MYSFWCLSTSEGTFNKTQASLSSNCVVTNCYSDALVLLVAEKVCIRKKLCVVVFGLWLLYCSVYVCVLHGGIYSVYIYHTAAHRGVQWRLNPHKPSLLNFPPFDWHKPDFTVLSLHLGPVQDREAFRPCKTVGSYNVFNCLLFSFSNYKWQKCLFWIELCEWNCR